MKMELASQGFEVGLVTTHAGKMIDFYENLLGLEAQGQLDFPGGTQKRFTVGNSILKVVSYDEDPPLRQTPGGGRAQEGIRYISFIVANLLEMAESLKAAGIPFAEELTEFGGGFGWLFVEDPDGNWVEIAGALSSADS